MRSNFPSILGLTYVFASCRVSSRTLPGGELGVDNIRTVFPARNGDFFSSYRNIIVAECDGGGEGEES